MTGMTSPVDTSASGTSLSKSRSYLYATLSITFWGISFVSTKSVLQEISPYTLIAVRFAIGSLFLFFLLLLRRERFTVSRSHLPRLGLLALIGVFIHQMIQATALQTAEATAAGWLITFSPVFTAVLSVLFLKEKFSLQKSVGIGIAVFGVLLLVSKGHWSNLGALTSYLGNWLMLLSTLNWAIYSIVLKRLSLPYGSVTVTFYTSLIGSLLIAPFFLARQGWNELAHVSFGGWMHLLFLGIFVSALGYLFWGQALEVLDATRVSVFLYMEPLATVLAAMVLLHESLLLTTVIGGILIVLGVATVNGQIRWRQKTVSSQANE